jgi:hypothetical protein
VRTIPFVAELVTIQPSLVFVSLSPPPAELSRIQLPMVRTADPTPTPKRQPARFVGCRFAFRFMSIRFLSYGIAAAAPTTAPAWNRAARTLIGTGSIM